MARLSPGFTALPLNFPERPLDLNDNAPVHIDVSGCVFYERST